MSEFNNQIQNYSYNNFSNNIQNNSVILRQSNREMQLNINPEIFQSFILNSINNFIKNLNNQNNQDQIQIQIWQGFGKELEDMFKHLIEAFCAVNENILDLRLKCGEAFSIDEKYKENNNKNIDKYIS